MDGPHAQTSMGLRPTSGQHQAGFPQSSMVTSSSFSTPTMKIDDIIPPSIMPLAGCMQRSFCAALGPAQSASGTVLINVSRSAASQSTAYNQRLVHVEAPAISASVPSKSGPFENSLAQLASARAYHSSSAPGKYGASPEDLTIRQHIPEGLARVERRQKNPTGRDLAYIGFLSALASWGYFDSLPLDSSGFLHVNIPHCGAFSEAPLLLPFLVKKVLCTSCGVNGIVVHCCDLEASQLWWATFKEWARRTLDPRVHLEFVRKDLVTSMLPPAGLILAVHPGPDLSPGDLGPWRYILENVLNSRTPGGRCIFASFYEHEVQGIRMVCESLGASAEVRPNPYYQTDPMPYYIDYTGVKAHPLRYITITNQR